MSGNTFKISKGNGGLGKITVTHKSGSLIEVYFKGAHLVSWKDPKGQEGIYLSPKSYFDSERPIRGGIPLVFPQFGPGDLPPHGFARLAVWKMLRQEILPDGSSALTLGLSDTEWTRGMWNHEFSLEYKLILRAPPGVGSSLVCQFTVKNTGPLPFDFAFLYHTYYYLSDLGSAKVTGLKNYKVTDSINGGDLASNDPLDFHIAEKGLMNLRVNDTHCGIVLTDTVLNRSLSITRSANQSNMVMWNPGPGDRNADFTEDSYRHFICVEPGAVAPKNLLTPGESIVFSQILAVS